MAYVDPSIHPTPDAGAVPGHLGGVYVRRAEGLSTRRLVLTLDVVVLAAFAAIHGGVAGVAYAVLALFGLKAARVYGPRIQPRLGDDVPRLLAAVVTPVIVLPLFASSRELGSILATLPFVVFALLVGRSVTYTILNRARAAGHRHDRVLLVGAGDPGVEMARILREHPKYGLEPVGFVDEIALGSLPLPLLGGVEDLSRLVAIHGIDRVIVAGWEGEDDVLLPALRACTARHVQVHVAPRLFQLGTAPANPRPTGCGPRRSFVCPPCRGTRVRGRSSARSTSASRRRRSS